MFAALALAGSATLSAGTDGPHLERLATFDLPEEVATATDVRWQEDDTLLLGVAGNGVYSWRVGEERADLSVTLAGSRLDSVTRFQDYSRLGGVSSGVTVFSSRTYGTFRHDASGISASKAVEIVGDLDRRHARTAVVGLSRNPDGSWEDRLAWLISDDGTVRGVLPKRTDSSYWLLAGRLGVVRILSEDRILAIPGLEPDIFLYDWSGRLREVLGTETFFAESPWMIEPEQEPLLSEPSWFTSWLSRHRVIDEVVSDERGNVFVFVRHVPADLPYPAHVVSHPRWGRVTGGGTVVDASGNVTSVESDEKAARLLELLENAGEIDIASGEPVRIQNEDLNRRAVRILAAPDTPRPLRRTRVCWDLVHAQMDDLQTATRSDCVVESEFADTRLRADLRDDRAAILLGGNSDGNTRRSEAFEARLVPASR